VEPIAVRLTVSLRPRKAVCTTGAPPPTSALAAPTPASTNSSMLSNSRGGVAFDGSSMSSPRESHTQQHCGSPPRLVAQRQGHTQRAAASASASVSAVDGAAQRQGQEHAGGRGVWSDIAPESAAKRLGGGGGQERGGRSWVGHRRRACHGSVYVGPIRLPQGQRHTLRNLHRGAPRLNASPEHIYGMHGQRAIHYSRISRVDSSPVSYEETVGSHMSSNDGLKSETPLRGVPDPESRPPQASH